LSVYLIGSELEVNDKKLIENLTIRRDTLILLDQLQYKYINVPSSSFENISPLELLGSLVPLFAASVPIRVLISVQADRHSIEHFDFREILSVNVRSDSIEITPLSSSEGAELFRLSGCPNISQTLREHLSERLGGLPICIIAAAKQFNAFSNLVDREAYSIDITSTDTLETSVATFFDSYIELISAQNPDANSHPEAILRLLALMPGPTSKYYLTDLLNKIKIRRLEYFDVYNTRNLPRPFVTESGDRVGLHPMARDNIRRQLDDIVSGKIVDRHTSQSEIAAIHLAAARLSFDVIKEAPERMTLTETEAIEGSIFHLLRYRDTRTNLRTRHGQRKFFDTWANIFSGAATNREITEFCFREIAQKFLFDGQLQVTRSLGQYETKAKVLCHFFRNRLPSSNIEYLDENNWFVLLTEIAICFMHCGRLKLAASAIYEAKQILQRRELKMTII
jgi:hypothetical protein